MSYIATIVEYNHGRITWELKVLKHKFNQTYIHHKAVSEN